MKNRLIAIATAASLVLSSAIVTPAAAMSDRDRQALTLLLGVAAVGLIINESNKKKRRREAEVQRSYNDDRDIYWDSDRNRRKSHERLRNRNIPAQCVFSVRGRKGPRDVVSSRCMNEYGMSRRLPSECALDIDSGWGSRTVYGANCLRRNGFRIAEAR